MKNKNLKLILSIVGAVVVAGTLVVALIHFWEDLKKLLPGCKCEAEEDDFEDIEV